MIENSHLNFRGKRPTHAKPYVLMSFSSYVSRVSGCPAPLRRQPISLLAHQQAGKANFYVLQHKSVKYPLQDLAYTQVSPTFAPLDIKIPARLRTGKPALLPASGHKRSCPPPESAKLRDFFCTPQRAGIQRVTSISREIPENFSKISSPKIWCVCQKSVPLHSQIRNEAYNTSQI